MMTPAEQDLETSVAALVEAMGHPWPGLPPRPKHAVVGTDGSRASRDAVAWASTLADTIHLVHATEPYMGGTVGGYVLGSVDDWETLMRGEAQDAYKAVRKAARGKSIREHTLTASPARAIRDVAKDVGAGLIVSGWSGKGATKRLLLGSVTEALLHQRERTVLVTRNEPVDGPIVAGLAFDEQSILATAWATAMAQWTGRELHIVHSAPKDVVQDHSTGSPEDRFEIVAWPPKEGLLQALDRHEAALAAVGHGRRPAWLGSTAIHLARRAPSSVLVARPW